MAEHLVLHASAHRVAASVRDPHDVECISNADGMIEVRRQPGSERLRQIRGGHLDALEPGGIGVRCPFPQVNSGVAFDHVDHPACFEVDEPGRVDRVMVPVRQQERRFVHTQLADLADSVRVVNKWGAVLDHGVHDRLPTHPELAGDLRHRTRQLTDTAACFGTGPAGQHDLGVQELERFSPRPSYAQRLAA